MTSQEAQLRERIRCDIEELRRRGVEVGENCQVWGCVDLVFPEKVRIGRNCVIAGEAALLSHGPFQLEGERCVIGDNCYIGYGAIILPGVTVGAGSIVGAGAVVTENVPPEMIVAGNPARRIRDRDPYELTDYIARREAGELL